MHGSMVKKKALQNKHMAQHIKNKFTYQYSLAYFHLKYKGHTWESNIHNYKERPEDEA